MAVRFRFRSSAAFESVDLGGRPSISVSDLRSRILHLANLPICRDFDLLISDALSGHPFEDEEFQIPAGSSVIVKRVPAGRFAPSDPVGGNSAIKNRGFANALVSSPSENVEMDGFDDFGNDLYPALEAPLPESDANIANINIFDKQDDISRSLETPISRCQNIEGSDLSEAMSKEIIRDNYSIECDIDNNKKQTKLKSKRQEQNKFDEGVGLCSPTMLNADLPPELRCFLCNTIFKEAVMIPCCQHSFCDKCIRSALVERARCPMCSSTRCTVKDLLPNLSLRQAIEHFLEAQVAVNDLDKNTPKYAPDGESGIQAKELSCAVSVRQQEPQFPNSPSATGKGSNQIMIESAYENKRSAGINILLDTAKSVKSAPSSHKVNQIKGDENSSAEALKQMHELQECGSSSKLPQSLPLNKEVNLTIQRKKGSAFNTPDGSGALMPPSKNRKGTRNCYMCGSPNHLVRDCPAASNPYPGDAAFPGGISAYGHPFWHGASLPHFRPYANIYGAPGVMPFDPTVLQVSPFGMPSYMPSLYAGMAGPYLMRMGGVPPPLMAGAEHPLSHAEFMNLQDGERKPKLLNECRERELDYDAISEDNRYNEARRRSHERKHYLDKEPIRSCSDSDSQRIHKKDPLEKHHSPSHRRPGFNSDEEIYSADLKHKESYASVSRRNQRSHYSEKSKSERQDASNSSNWHSRDRRKHKHRSSKKHSEKRGQCSSDYGRRSHHRNQKEVPDDLEKDLKDPHRHSCKHHNHSENGLEPDLSSGRRQLIKEKESSHSSRHSKSKVNLRDDQLEVDRWEMVDSSDEDYRGENYHHKRKRTH
ncbi:E3 ubiquitin ligase PQT3-like isoform X2 [Phoenix dactylifera]|uniref:E3 ubiquitin ligase PQT3-like isoform X2 n=1 Tax=Phoenix dactylifera TaxID=42345 RepID=A0A8B7MVA0_PHODC|nr:E3 ubiquitin ligase PQT3-like isoform X2 [Phoenix dactylifera]